MLGDYGIKVVDWMVWNSKKRTLHPSRKPTHCKLKIHKSIKNLLFPFLVNFRNTISIRYRPRIGGVRNTSINTTEAILLTPAVYMWQLFHALQIPIINYIFRVRTAYPLFLKFYDILTQQAYCIKKKVFSPDFIKISLCMTDLLYWQLVKFTIYRENNISTPVSIERIWKFWT